MKEPIFLTPVFQERIWGGTALKDRFQYEIPSDQTGECWAISAHPNGQSIIANGPLAGRPLGDAWKEHREWFGNVGGDVFPLLTKILDANADLSVQVHPNDEYANKHENGELGKTECWYIIDCKENAELIFGHHAQTKEELVSLIENGEWDKLLRRVTVKPGDFFYVPSGTVHALCEGTLVLETQQSSDTTYRVYDYDRTDAEGNKRELHLEKAIDVTTVPHSSAELNYDTYEKDDAKITRFVEAEYFTVYKWELNGKAHFDQEQPYLLASVIDGEGKVTVDGKTFEVKSGTHFIVPATVSTFSVEGQMKLIVSHP
ncbi:mannose-6-phosphate isomerase, class I [Bacillus carboniphilus]|uniref:Mannose-6-phosphate isomerase n=1 Tax=Bacillus carboniphilus TaxID=86663 RepID=A0ABN0VRX5_9BACI